MPLLWLASYGHGQLRSRTGQTDRPLRLPNPPWFHGRVIKRNLQHLLAVGRERVQFRALACVSPCTFHQGALSPFDAESLLQCEYYMWPRDVLSVTIQRLAAVDPPVDSDQRAAPRSQHGCAPVHVALDAMLYLPYWADTLAATSVSVRSGATATTAGEVLQSWGVQQSLDEAPCLMLPRIMIELMLAGEWRTVVCLARWEKHSCELACHDPSVIGPRPTG